MRQIPSRFRLPGFVVAASSRTLRLSQFSAFNPRPLFIGLPVAKAFLPPISSSPRSSTTNSNKAKPIATAPLKFPTQGFQLYDPSDKVEEETLPTYDAKAYYPARLGEIIRHGKDQYQLVTKLGYGSSSTVWLCYNLVTKDYKTLKIHVNTLPFNRELEIFQHLDSFKHAEHPGRAFLRALDDSFQIKGPHGTHEVFVFAPLGFSLRRFQKRMPDDQIFDKDLVRMALFQALIGLNYLHDVANVTHTDFHSDNLLMSITDDSIFADVVKAETVTDPSHRKQTEDGVIYSSRDIALGAGEIILCDFGVARIGKEHEGMALPLQYRTPEVLLGSKWGHSVDVWSFALTAWDLIQPAALFRIHSETDMELNTAHHLADMVALLGPPPKEFLRRSMACEKYWDNDGKFVRSPAFYLVQG